MIADILITKNLRSYGRGGLEAEEDKSGSLTGTSPWSGSTSPSK
jgi:hypothetical protein